MSRSWFTKQANLRVDHGKTHRRCRVHGVLCLRGSNHGGQRNANANADEQETQEQELELEQEREQERGREQEREQELEQEQELEREREQELELEQGYGIGNGVMEDEASSRDRRWRNGCDVGRHGNSVLRSVYLHRHARRRKCKPYRVGRRKAGL